ncbi:Os06g0225350, partial [Oryza sativa Japonica Group]
INASHCTLWVGWFTISPSGRVDVIICGRGGTRPRGPYQFEIKNNFNCLSLLWIVHNFLEFVSLVWIGLRSNTVQLYLFKPI